MHKTSHMPAGWMPAYAHFAQFSDEQLLEQSLPTEQSRRKNILRCIYTNGTRFVYYKGDFDDEKLRCAEKNELRKDAVCICFARLGWLFLLALLGTIYSGCV